MKRPSVVRKYGARVALLPLFRGEPGTMRRWLHDRLDEARREMLTAPTAEALERVRVRERKIHTALLNLAWCPR